MPANDDHFDRPRHRKMFEWARRTGLLSKMLGFRESSAFPDLVVILAAPATEIGEALQRRAREQGCAEEVSARFSAQRRAGVPRFLIGLTTVEGLQASSPSVDAAADLERAAATGDVPAFIIDQDGYWCGTLVEPARRPGDRIAGNR